MKLEFYVCSGYVSQPISSYECVVKNMARLKLDILRIIIDFFLDFVLFGS